MSGTHIDTNHDTAIATVAATATETATDTTTAAAAIMWCQVKTLVPLLLAIYIPTLVTLVVLVIVNIITGIPVRYFMIDPVSEFAAPMYLGLVSNLGVLLWCSTAAVCLFSGGMSLNVSKDREVSLFMLCSGLITSMLLFDDLFLLHEEVLPDHLFIPQKLVFAAYAGLTLTYLFRFKRMILNTEYTLLLLAFGFFGLSVFVDLFVTPEEFLIAGYHGRHLIEDGLKLFGIVTWSAYFIRVCIQKVRPLLHHPLLR